MCIRDRAYGDAKRYIDSFRKDDYALFYSKGRGIIAVGQIVTDKPTEVGDEKYHSVRMIVPENFNGDVKACLLYTSRNGSTTS